MSVSVSLRSIIHSYLKKIWENLLYRKFPSPCGVSFILMLLLLQIFHLLVFRSFPSPCGVSFILILPIADFIGFLIILFPSPCGVSFILIGYKNGYIGGWLDSFRLLTEYHSFLSYGQKRLLLQYVFRVLSWDICILKFFLFILNKIIFNPSFFGYRLITIFFVTL